MAYIDNKSLVIKLMEEQKRLPFNGIERKVDLSGVGLGEDNLRESQERRIYKDRTEHVSIGQY